MAGRLSPQTRAGLWLVLRLVIFAGVTYAAAQWFLLAPTKETLFDSVQDTGLAVVFRANSLAATGTVSVFGKTVLESTRKMQLLTRGSGTDRDARKYAIWKEESDGDFYPWAGTPVYAVGGSNWMDYNVMPPIEPGAWKFKVTHRIDRQIQMGPFRFQCMPRYIIYTSPVMTNTLSPPDPPKAPSRRAARRKNP